MGWFLQVLVGLGSHFLRHGGGICHQGFRYGTARLLAVDGLGRSDYEWHDGFSTLAIGDANSDVCFCVFVDLRPPEPNTTSTFASRLDCEGKNTCLVGLTSRPSPKSDLICSCSIVRYNAIGRRFFPVLMQFGAALAGWDGEQ